MVGRPPTGIDSIGWRDENLRVRGVELRSAQESLLVWYWYVVNDQATGDDYRAKLLLARERFLRRPQGGDRVVVFTRIVPDADAVDALEDFVSRLSMDTSVPAE